MLIKTFKVIFEILIGKVPENKRAYYREVFYQFVQDVVRARAEGFSKGAIEGSKNVR